MKPIRHIFELSEPQNHRCCYCGHAMIKHIHVDGVPTPRNAMTKDHFEPRVYGGGTFRSNLIAACCQCNNLRGEMEAEAFYNLMQKRFKRDESLWQHWHSISRRELHELKQHCRNVHERQLFGLAKRHIEHAFRHWDFTRRHEEWELRKRAWA